MIIDLLLPAALAFIMFSLGLGLVPADFLRVFARPAAVGLGLTGQMIAVPAIGFVIAAMLHRTGLPPAVAVGTVILAACPGGVSSGLLTRLANGDTALSISLTAISSLLAVLTLPLLTGAALEHFMARPAALEIPVAGMVRGIFLLTTVPVVLGMLLRRALGPRARQWEAMAGRIATGFFVLIVFATFVNQREVLLAHLGSVGLAMLALNLLTMACGYGLATVGGLDRRGGIAVAMECGLQNAALGIFVAGTVLREPGFAVPSVVYALLMNAGALALVFARRRAVV